MSTGERGCMQGGTVKLYVSEGRVMTHKRCCMCEGNRCVRPTRCGQEDVKSSHEQGRHCRRSAAVRLGSYGRAQLLLGEGSRGRRCTVESTGGTSHTARYSSGDELCAGNDTTALASVGRGVRNTCAIVSYQANYGVVHERHPSVVATIRPRRQHDAPRAY